MVKDKIASMDWKIRLRRGYTLAEPDWPIVQPTTYFRLASVSKTVTALAVFQLLETGALDAATSVQDILNLSAPGGGPANPGFASVTVQSLLEHRERILLGLAFDHVEGAIDDGLGD